MILLSKEYSAYFKKYETLIRAMSSLSQLFSDSKTPFLHYRVVENIFCLSYKADNISRNDIAYDAKLGNLGVGIKTFILRKNSSTEKIAEFNMFSKELKTLKGMALANKLSKLRNERILFANRNYNINKSIYHCIGREENMVRIFENNYSLIDNGSIKVIKEDDKSFRFSDKDNIYVFNYSKSTLFQKFVLESPYQEINIEIMEDPYSFLLDFLNNYKFKSKKKWKYPGRDYVILPLYSTKFSNKSEKVVAQKSGLNQWNAGGRQRDPGEVYLPIPSLINKKCIGFFPKRDKIFNLRIPDGNFLQAKICQDDSKALMTNPNKALATWMLRDILLLKEGELLTYNKLKEIGADSMVIHKLDGSNYEIDFSSIGSYEYFISQL